MSVLSDLDTKGYVIIPKFLDTNEVELLYNDYQGQSIGDNQNYYIKMVSESIKPVIYKKINNILALVKEQTLLDVDLIIPIAFYMNNKLINFPWHQDHESFYTLQQSRNYLNFYIPVLKEYSNKSGLQIVPFNNIEKHIPNYLNKIQSNGATSYMTTLDSTLVRNDETGDKYIIPISINDISVTPELLAGDLLLLRGDIIHKTQDSLTSRISVSFRATQGNALISKQRLVNGCTTKQNFIKKNPRHYEMLLKTFDRLGKDNITAFEHFGKNYTPENFKKV